MTAFRNLSALRVAITSIIVAAVLVACATAGHAQAGLDRHERKIHKKLLKYSEGSYLHLVLHDKTNSYGSLGSVTDASFTFKNADSNAVATYSFDDVARVKTDREPIGRGSEPEEHHYIRPRTLIIAGVLAAGAGVAAAEVR